MKGGKVFITPVVLLLFLLLPGIIHAEKGGVSDLIVADTIIGHSEDKQGLDHQREFDQAMNESYGSRMDSLLTMMGKNPRQRYEDSRHPIWGRDGMLDMGIRTPVYQAIHKKRPDIGSVKYIV